MQTVSVPLDKLSHSPLNTRRTGGQNVADLVGLIAAEGLLQNLIVIPEGEGFGVIAGGRRLRALQQLASTDSLPVSLAGGIPCLVADAARATTISLTENIHEAMHPADQCDVFRALLAQESEADVAARFNVTLPYLRQRLKLANVSPKIIEAFRADKLSLGQVEAYALSNDHPHQERVFKSLGGKGEAYEIRRRLTQGQVDEDDRRVKLLGGIAAYEAAGGAVHRDMFTNEAYVVDVKLLDKLVDEKLEAEKQKLLDAGWQWAEAGLDLESYRYQHATKPDKAKHGAIIFMPGWSDKLQIETGRLKPGEREKLSSGGKKGNGKSAKPKNPAGLSFAQTQLLQAERTCALRLHLAGAPRIAMAGLAASLLHELFRAGADYHRGTDETVRIAQRDKYSDRTPLPTRDVMQKSAAQKAIDQQVGEFKKRAAGKPLFAWLLEQPESVTHEALALAAGVAAMTVQMVDGPDHAAAFCGLAGLDMARTWKVTPEWLAQQPASYLVAAVTEYRGKELGGQVARAKGKAGVVAAAAPLLAGWLPKPLRGPTYASKASAPAPAAVAPAPAQKPVSKPTKAKAAVKRAGAGKAAKKPAKKAAAPAKRPVAKKAAKKAAGKRGARR